MLVFQDEVHFTINTLITRKWFIKGSNPKVKSYPGRLKTSYSGYVVPENGKFYFNRPATFTFETVIESLRDFIKNNPLADGIKYYIVMDNAPWHQKAKRIIKENQNGEYDDINSKVVFVYLPSYSPDLNPIEQVWRVLRREVTHNTYFATIEKLSTAIETYLSKYLRPNEKLKKLCSFKTFASA